jgi:hypothetical protein
MREESEVHDEPGASPESDDAYAHEKREYELMVILKLTELIDKVLVLPDLTSLRLAS